MCNPYPKIQTLAIVMKNLQEEAGEPAPEVSKTHEKYRPKIEFASRTCAGRSTSAMPELRCLCAPAFVVVW